VCLNVLFLLKLLKEAILNKISFWSTKNIDAKNFHQKAEAWFIKQQKECESCIMRWLFTKR